MFSFRTLPRLARDSRRHSRLAGHGREHGGAGERRVGAARVERAPLHRDVLARSKLHRLRNRAGESSLGGATSSLGDAKSAYDANTLVGAGFQLWCSPCQRS